MSETGQRLIEAAKQAREIAEIAPTVQAFHHYYHMHGPDKADGLIAGLIAFKAQLDADAVPLKN